MQKMKLGHCLTEYTRINSKWIKDLDVRPETIKLIEENIDSTLFDIGLSNIFLGMSPQARKTKEKNKQMGLNQTKKLLHKKGNHQHNEKTTFQTGKDICKSYIQ